MESAKVLTSYSTEATDLNADLVPSSSAHFQLSNVRFASPQQATATFTAFTLKSFENPTNSYGFEMRRSSFVKISKSKSGELKRTWTKEGKVSGIQFQHG